MSRYYGVIVTLHGSDWSCNYDDTPTWSYVHNTNGFRIGGRYHG